MAVYLAVRWGKSAARRVFQWDSWDAMKAGLRVAERAVSTDCGWAGLKVVRTARKKAGPLVELKEPPA